MRKLIAVLLACSAATAHADDDSIARANVLFEQAQAKYAAGEFRAAIVLFEEAYSLARDPVYLFNIAQSHRKLFDCVGASTHFERFLAESTELDAAQRNQIKAWMKELVPCVEERRREAATRRKTDQRISGVVSPDRFREVDHGRRYRLAGIATTGLGAVLITAGVVYGRRGANVKAELAAACATGCDWNDTLESKERRGERANVLSFASYLGGGVAVAGGLALYLIGRSKPIERILIAPTTGGATVAARFRF